MANLKSVIKRARQNIKRRQANAAQRSAYRTLVKNVVKAVDTKDQALAQEAYQKAQPVIDKTARKGLIHKNKAARIKSRLVIKIKALSAA